MTIVAIIGPSGAGKDTVADIIADMTGFEKLISYTTRPMREGEKQGREHHFVKQCTTPPEKFLANTVYGGYEYWTTIEQLNNHAVYVIDDEGLRSLRQRFPEIDIVTVFVTAKESVRLERGVSPQRIERDSSRLSTTNIGSYDHVVINNESFEALFDKVSFVAERIMSIL